MEIDCDTFVLVAAIRKPRWALSGPSYAGRSTSPHGLKPRKRLIAMNTAITTLTLQKIHFSFGEGHGGD